MGFVRVGAVARYTKSVEEVEDTRTVGYRHWCYADESVEEMDKPSYM